MIDDRAGGVDEQSRRIRAVAASWIVCITKGRPVIWVPVPKIYRDAHIPSTAAGPGRSASGNHGVGWVKLPGEAQGISEVILAGDFIGMNRAKGIRALKACGCNYVTFPAFDITVGTTPPSILTTTLAPSRVVSLPSVISKRHVGASDLAPAQGWFARSTGVAEILDFVQLMEGARGI